jgi:pimeloyl-ACP methyl ester carboxylesterase
MNAAKSVTTRRAVLVLLLLLAIGFGSYLIGRQPVGEPSINEQRALPAFWSKMPRPGQNNIWYEPNDSKTVFVFVHGIFSDSRGCWLAVDPKDQAHSQYWPELINNDDRLEHPAIFLGGYATAVDSGPYDIRQAAGELRDALKRNDVLKKDRIIFIAHSTGGIITRFLLVHNQDLFRGKAIGVVLYASPSSGAPLAKMLSFLSEFYRNSLGMQLQPSNPTLIDLNNDFKDLIYNPNSDPDNLTMTGAEGVENFFIVHRRWWPDTVLVVPEESASSYWGAPKYLRRTNHFTTVKPTSIDDPGHELLITFYDKYKHVFHITGPAEPTKKLPVFTTVFSDKNESGQPFILQQVVDKNGRYTQPPKPAGDNGHEIVVDLAAPGPITDVTYRAEGRAGPWTHQTAINLTDNGGARWIGWSNSGDSALLIFTITYKRAEQVCIKNCD